MRSLAPRGPGRAGKLVDLWEVGCRWDLFPVVSREKLRHIANSDFHRPEHLYAWKTSPPLW